MAYVHFRQVSRSSAKVPRLTRRISGAEAHHFPERGRPSSWELKSTELLTPKGWRNRRHRTEIGIVVMDRSNDRLDAHASHCVASYVTSKSLPLHPVVHYVDSMTSEPTQAADLISAARRRTIEGTPGMHVLNTQLASLRAQGLTATRTHTHRPWTNQIVVI